MNSWMRLRLCSDGVSDVGEFELGNHILDVEYLKALVTLLFIIPCYVSVLQAFI